MRKISSEAVLSLNSGLRLLVILATAFSLAALSGPMSSSFHLPYVPLAHATPQTCEVVGSSGACSERWYPAGPAMNNLNFIGFNGPTSMFTDLCSTSSDIDFPDAPFTPPSCNPGFLVTAPVAEISYFEIEFHLANNFWNCGFSFGNSACGVDLRQGIAHMFDKASFCQNLVPMGTCTPLDVPVPTSSGGGLPSPNPCAYDARFPQTGTNCVVGSPGGTAYHLKASTGANGSPWLYAPGSADLNAAAAHFVAAGVASGFNNVTSILTNPVTTTTPTFFIRTDSPPRQKLGESLAAQICHMFTGSYAQPCSPFLNTVEGPITAFPGGTSPTSIRQSWWLYTAGFSGVQFFDSSLYFTYNSRFVSGIPSIQPPNGPCSPLSVPTSNAADYMYLCSPTYDNLSNQMESSPCLKSPLDPATGQSNNGPGGPCTSDPTKLSAISAGIQGEASFGSGAFTIPVFEQTVQYEYLNGWIRVDNGVHGVPNYFTWLNAYNPTAVVPWTIRQGFSEAPRSLNPYIASTRSDFFLVGNIYDSLSILDPLATGSSVNWMTLSRTQFSNSTLTYTPPPGTFTTYRFTLWNSLFFQDGRPVTAYDVAFSYLSMVGSGAALGVGASGMTGITVIGPRVFDIGIRSPGPFTLSGLTGVPIIPGRYWTGAGSPAWDTAVQTCTSFSSCPISQYTLSGSTVSCSMNCSPFSAALMSVNPADITPIFDPGPNGVLVGSGPWQCGTVTTLGSSGCYNTVVCPPLGGPCPSSYRLTRFGNGIAPAQTVSNTYFRSSGNLALQIWTEENDENPIQALSFVSICFGQPVNPLGPCAHWQTGIGASLTGVVGISQLSIVELRFNLNWISPFEWTVNPPLGIGLFPPVLYEGPVTLNPCSIDSINGYDC